MAKRVDPLKAKEAKQKKIAIGGVVLLLALLGVQGPKTLKMLKGAPAGHGAGLDDARHDDAGRRRPQPPRDPRHAAGEVPAAPAAELTAVADSDLSPEAAQGQLATFERFASKDPFAQQAEPVEQAPAPAADPKATTAPAKTPRPARKRRDAGSSGDAATDGGLHHRWLDAPDAPAVAGATSISVNGVAEDVEHGRSFPKDEPTFVLAKVAKNGKSVEIGIAGGEYASGGKTITLALGKKLTLQNTADGTRYELELLTVQGQPVPKKK